ncbi:uncharacterized membrane protein YkvA (DUF1232 family) [Saccharomonospora amisosensis]|uniref:Uncharacterized membrane protein YkvA (DUF1232 family) n=1 Tax=Saccharomonospora amisosensis TaxID=1128677 RepID=A0A7X5UQW8_9PSEU|nr:DUF1232 domain-containing protein [Saccharomonospora amisosensis]NIJ12495.1 uncharacterized membrane protein YkvA (DUF1232 family) [Saccharomonospora amisosensis]
MTDFWWGPLVVSAAALVVVWLALVVALVVANPRGRSLSEAMRLLPDLLRLVRRLATDRELPLGVRLRLWLLLAYLALPIDLVPDFIPVLGHADDAIVVTVVLRSTARRAGSPALARHWPGTAAGFSTLCRLTGLKEP